MSDDLTKTLSQLFDPVTAKQLSDVLTPAAFVKRAQEEQNWFRFLEFAAEVKTPTTGNAYDDWMCLMAFRVVITALQSANAPDEAKRGDAIRRTVQNANELATAFVNYHEHDTMSYETDPKTEGAD